MSYISIDIGGNDQPLAGVQFSVSDMISDFTFDCFRQAAIQIVRIFGLSQDVVLDPRVDFL